MMLFILLVLNQKAFGYIDPGTGSYVIQMLLAALFGALFAIKVFWTRLKSFFRSIFSKVNNEKHEK